MLGNEEGVLPDAYHKIGPLNLILTRLDEKSVEEQLDFLQLHKMIIYQKMRNLNDQSQRIKEKIKVLKEKSRVHKN